MIDVLVFIGGVAFTLGCIWLSRFSGPVTTSGLFRKMDKERKRRV